MFPQTIQDWVEQANVNDQGSNINARRHFEGWSLGLCLNFVKDDSIDREVEKQFVGEAPDNLNNWRVIENNDAEMKFAKTERYSKSDAEVKVLQEEDEEKEETGTQGKKKRRFPSKSV